MKAANHLQRVQVCYLVVVYQLFAAYRWGCVQVCFLVVVDQLISAYR
jgi:hypothetical protein